MRKVVLKIHLFMGVTAALFLIVLGLTGSIMALEGDIDHWLHPHFWYVDEGSRALLEGTLVASVERQFAPERVAAVQISQHPDVAQLMQLTNSSMVTVNPYTGKVIGQRSGPSRTERWLGFIHQVHLRLAGDGRAPWARAGKIAVSYAGLLLFLLAPTGLLLWWRTKRTTIRWKAAWFSICFDTHQVIGIYAGLFLWISALTGILIGFESGERAVYWLTHSSPPAFGTPPQSTPAPGTVPIGIDRAIATAQQAIQHAAVDLVILPTKPNATYQVILRVPEETSGSAHSSVNIDQFSGATLAVRNFLTDSKGFRWIRSTVQFIPATSAGCLAIFCCLSPVCCW
jgi:uncharacterized iron-regulated membrane protein